MPKSNFNQFLDECEDFRTAKNTSMNKISFETKSPCNHEYENQTNETNQNGHGHNDIKNLNTFSSNSNIRCGSSSSSSSSSSSNIFLSKSATNSRDRFDRFSTNRMSNYTNATGITNVTTTSATSVQTNIFKKADDSSQCFNPTTPPITSTSMPKSTTTIEINNETFPSLTSATTTLADTASSVPKKFKNFKDAICAAATAPAPAPTLSTITTTKQKQTRALPTSAAPMVVKRDSEMYAKKVLAKTKNLAALYDDDDDDDNDDDIRDFGCNRNSKPTFINNYENDSD